LKWQCRNGRDHVAWQRTFDQARESRVGASPVLEALTASLRFAAHGRMSIAKKGHPFFVVRWQKETRR
jgi:hypothetical protein